MRKSSGLNIILLLLICLSAIFLCQVPTYAIEDDTLPFYFEYSYHNDEGYVFELVHQPGDLESVNLSWFYLESDDPLYSIGECSDVFTISAGVRYRYSLGYDTGSNYRRYIGNIEYIVSPDEEPYLYMESDGYHYIEYGISESEPNGGIQPAVAAYTTNPPAQRTLVGTTANSITWNSTTAPSGWSTQYSIRIAPNGAWGPWLSNYGAFTNLNPATGYQAQARFTADNASTHLHSAASPASITIWTAPNPPAQRAVSGTPTTTSLSVNTTSAPSGWSTQYRIRTGSTGTWGKWLSNYGTFTGLEPGTGYQVQARFTADDASTHGHSLESTASATITTQANTVTITWNANGGTPATQTSTKTVGGTIGTLPTQPTYSGYTFAGWYTSSSGGTQVTASTTVPSSNTTYYAHWTANTVTITWNANGGTPATQTSTKTVGGTIGTLPTQPTYSGYTFAGWYTSSSGGTQVTTSTTVPSSNTTYYAHWTTVPLTPTTISFVQSPYSATIPTSGSTTVTVSAQVKDQYGNVMSGYTPTYSLGSAYTGVSISGSVVTIQSTAAAGTVSVKATYGSLTATVNLNLSKTASINLNVSLNKNVSLFKITVDSGQELTNTIALKMETNTNYRVAIATINNTPIPSGINYSWKYTSVHDRTQIPASGSASTANKDVSVGVPSVPGKYDLEISFSGTEILSSKVTYPVYVTYGPIDDLLLKDRYEGGVNIYWLDSAFKKYNPQKPEIVYNLNKAFYETDGRYVFGSEAGAIRAGISGKSPEANCNNAVDILMTLCRLLGIQRTPGRNVNINIGDLKCDAFMMPPNRKCFGGTSGYFNGHNIFKITGGGSEEGAWIFGGDRGHNITEYEWIYYDPTFGLIGEELYSNVYALLDREKSPAGGSVPYTYDKVTYSDRYRLRLGSNNKFVATIAYSPEKAKSNGTNKWSQFDYLYIPTTNVSALSGGGEKTILMPYAALAAASNAGSSMTAASINSPLWTAAANDSWIHIVSSSNIYSTQTVDASDSEMLSITIDPNPTDELRTGTITVTTNEGEDIICIHQDGATADIEASQTTILAATGGGEYSVDITSNVWWCVGYDADWISLPFASGTGNDKLAIVTEENDTGETRTATVRIEGADASATIYVVQAPQGASSDAKLASLSVSEGILSPAFNAELTSYTVSVPYKVSSVDIAAIPNNAGANVSGTGAKNLSVGDNIFTVTVTAPDYSTTLNYTLTVTREPEPRTYILYFGSKSGESYYGIDAYPGIDQPVHMCAYAENSQGFVVTAPELVSMVYTADSGVSNTTGIFTKEELEISPGEETCVTATATFSDGTVLQTTTVVYAWIIFPK